MALVKCVECKKEISSKAKVCPHCGKKNPTVSFKDTVIGLIFLAVVVVLTMNFCGEGDTKEEAKIKSPPAKTKQSIPFLSDKEKKLYEKIRKIPAKEFSKNRDGYKKLLELNPNSAFYQKKFNHYESLARKTRSKEQSTIKILHSNDSSINDKALLQNYDFMNKNIGVYKRPTIISAKNHIILKTWPPYIEASASLAAKFSGPKGALKIRSEYGKAYEFTYDEQWEMTSKDRFNRENIPDKLTVYLNNNKVMALEIKRHFSYNPSTKKIINSSGYKTIQIIPRNEFLELEQ